MSCASSAYGTKLGKPFHIDTALANNMVHLRIKHIYLMNGFHSSISIKVKQWLSASCSILPKRICHLTRCTFHMVAVVFIFLSILHALTIHVVTAIPILYSILFLLSPKDPHTLLINYHGEHTL